MLGLNRCGQNTPALTQYIYPTLSKLLQANKNDDQVIKCIAAIKMAFDSTERTRAGLTQQFVTGMIEAAKKY